MLARPTDHWAAHSGNAEAVSLGCMAGEVRQSRSTCEAATPGPLDCRRNRNDSRNISSTPKINSAQYPAESGFSTYSWSRRLGGQC